MNMRHLLITSSLVAVAAGGGSLAGTGAETGPAAAPAAQSGTATEAHGGDASYVPVRINKAIELLERDQPIYYTQVDSGGYEEGKALAQTWADYITYNMEHSPFDMNALRAFMQGLVDGGPTRSGHRTPAVVAVLPFGGIDEQVMWANYWMVEQVLGAGVHGVLLAHARSPEVVRVLVQAARYPHAPEAKGVGEGLRGNGGQGFAARIWGLTNAEYQRGADAWPLNPEGELLIGLKIEDRHALQNAEASVGVPGVGFAEWGPGDMSLSFDVNRADAPQVLADARARVLAATKQAGIPFLNRVRADDIEQMIDEGVRIGSNPGAEVADRGRRYTNRRMPW